MRPFAILPAAAVSLPAAASLAAAFLALAAPAGAATYVVRSCDSGSISGWWTPLYRPAGSSCGVPGGSLHARLEGDAGESETWNFQAPADTDIAGFSIDRGFWLNATLPYGSPVYALQTLGPGARYADVRPNLTYGAVEADGLEVAAGLTRQYAVEASLVCGGGGACRRPAGTFAIRSARILLRDVHDPVIGTVSGTLADGGRLTGIRGLQFSASDRGGGVLRAELLVDGAVVRSAAVGACEPDATGAFADVVPCKATASGAFSLDTLGLADGPHAVALRVYDATGVNADGWVRTVEVANRPAEPTATPAAAAPGARPAEVAAPAAAPAPLASAASARLTAWLEPARRRQQRVTVTYGTRVRIRGVLRTRDGAPIGHAPITVLETVAGRRPAAITGLRTRGDGRLTSFARVGPSRTLQLAYDGVRSARLQVAVRAAPRLLAVRRGSRLALSGALRGGAVPAGGVLVVIEARRGGRWVVLASAHSDWAGRFRARVPAADAAPAAAMARLRLRAAVPRQHGYPFAAGSGPAVEVLE
jgi:hypothetical protein